MITDQMIITCFLLIFFFFNDTAPTEIYTLSLHDALPILGFRWWVWRQATRLGLRGLARNLRDGSVEVIAEGPDSRLVELEGLLAQGPPAAQVERVEKSQVPHEVRMPNGFDIK